MPTTRYPKRVQRNLEIIENAFNTSDSAMQPEMRLLVAALRSLGFGVNRAMAGYPTEQWSKSGAPNVDIESPLMSYILQQYDPLPQDWWLADTPGFRSLRAKLRKINLEAKIELMKLIEEFYRGRSSCLDVHLDFHLGPFLGEFRLYCRWAEKAALLKHADYADWHQRAVAEMQDFAEFLCTKVED